MMKEELFCSAVWHYYTDSEKSITVRYIIAMLGEVDGKILRQAVDNAMSRYPYLAQRLVVTPERYYLVPNELPVVVKEGFEPITLGGEEANHHQIALSWFKNRIFFNNTHAIFDGRGRGPLLHTIMYYYCQARYGIEVKMDGVNLAGSPVDPAEYYDPFVNELPQKSYSLPVAPEPDKILRLDKAGLVTLAEPQLHTIRVPEKELMACCASVDGTPNTTISLLMCRAIRHLHPDNELPILAGVYCDLRNALNAPKTHYSLVSTLDLEFSKEMEKLSFDMQNTIFRGKMLLLSDPAYLLEQQKAQKEFCAHLNSLPTVAQKNKAAQDAMNGLFQGHTFLVSYSGRSNFGNCDQFILGTSPQPFAHNIGILIEVTSADGWFDITLMQEWYEDFYFGAFLREFENLGIHYQLLYSSQMRPCRYELPPVTEE